MPSIEVNKKYRGILTEDSREDYYHFTLEKDSNLYLTAASDYMGWCDFEIYWVEDFGSFEAVQKMTMAEDKYVTSPGKPLSSYQLKNKLSSNHNQPSPTFKKGEYAIHIMGSRKAETETKNYKDRYPGSRGVYSFMLSTKSVKSATGVKCDPATLTMSPETEKTVKVTVTPADAFDTSVNIKVESKPEGIIEVTKAEPKEGEKLADNETLLNVKALKETGSATITIGINATDKKGNPITAACNVYVIEGCTAPNVAVGMKVDLTKYLGPLSSKAEKFVLDKKSSTKGVGSVAKTVFTAKNGGEVTVIKQVKDPTTKKFVDAGTVSFTVEAPIYQKDTSGKKPKDLKTLNTFVRDETIDVSEYVKCATIPAVKYISSEKVEKNFHVDETTGEVTVLGSGKCKVTVLFEDDVNTKARAYFTINATLPVMKAAKVIKTTAKKPTAIKLTKVRKTITLEEAPTWRIEGVSDDGKPDGTAVSDDVAVFEVVKTAKTNTNGITCNVTGKTAGKIAVIATVDGVDYYSIVEIK